jgi:GDPmannose 4,6-dehydratase
LKSALITGVSGQDGFHLTEFLQNKGYKIYGLLNGAMNSRKQKYIFRFPEVELIKGDLTDTLSLERAISLSNPNEIYNLGAISYVDLSYKQPELTANVTGLGPLRLLEAVRALGLEQSVRIYQASTSEVYGRVYQVPQTELTNFNPISPYGIAKAYAHQICVSYRESYNMHISCGILFNHEGEFRGEDFVTRKISQGVANIVKGRQKKIRLGNLDSERDWGYAGDYVEAMWLMLQQDKPNDFVIATGTAHSVRDFLKEAILIAGLKGTPESFVVIDDSFIRPSDVNFLIGDASKAKEILGWEPKVDFKNLVKKMVLHDLSTQ